MALSSIVSATEIKISKQTKLCLQYFVGGLKLTCIVRIKMSSYVLTKIIFLPTSGKQYGLFIEHIFIFPNVFISYFNFSV